METINGMRVLVDNSLPDGKVFIMNAKTLDKLKKMEPGIKPAAISPFATFGMKFAPKPSSFMRSIDYGTIGAEFDIRKWMLWVYESKAKRLLPPEKLPLRFLVWTILFAWLCHVVVTAMSL